MLEYKGILLLRSSPQTPRSLRFYQLRESPVIFGSEAFWNMLGIYLRRSSREVISIQSSSDVDHHQCLRVLGLLRGWFCTSCVVSERRYRHSLLRAKTFVSATAIKPAIAPRKVSSRLARKGILLVCSSTNGMRPGDLNRRCFTLPPCRHLFVDWEET